MDIPILVKKTRNETINPVEESPKRARERSQEALSLLQGDDGSLSLPAWEGGLLLPRFVFGLIAFIIGVSRGERQEQRNHERRGGGE